MMRNRSILRPGLVPLVTIAVALVAMLNYAAAMPAGEGSGDSPEPPASADAFRDATVSSGLDFRHFNGMIGEKYIVEVMGSGCALFDYDNDGDLDAYLVQGASLEADGSIDAALFPPAADDLPPRDRLFRNDLTTGSDGQPVVRFVDVTNESGIDARLYGMGAAVGDADGDGDLDLYVTNYGPDQFWRNNGDGTFADASDEAGFATGGAAWSVSATWFDAEGDGDLDLFVARYVAWSRDVHKRCEWFGGRNDYCGPLSFQPLPDQLWLNDGRGHFRDASEETGIAAAPGAGLGVIAGDWNRDGLADLFVANDAMPNHLWINLGGAPPTFEESGFALGVAVGAEGYPEGSMGIAPGDADGDGDEDILLTHFTLQKNTFYRNYDGVFADQTSAIGIDWPSRPWTGFGVGWLEIDGDGWLDLFVANGAVHALDDRVKAGDPFPLGQHNQIFRYDPSARRFAEITGTRGGAAFAPIEVSRGAAFGDIDNDGDTDILVSNNNGPARLLLNVLNPREDGRLEALALDVSSPPDSPQATRRAIVRLKSGREMVRWSRRDGSYASSGSPIPLFVWPGDDEFEALLVERWVASPDEPGGGTYVLDEVSRPPGAGATREAPPLLSP
jgi:hypothetical protein